MIELKIQTETYWQEYTVTDQDIEELTFLFLETERPMTAVELGQALIANRCRREEKRCIGEEIPCVMSIRL